MSEKTVALEEGQPQDAKAVLSLISAAAEETDFITGIESMSEATPQDLASFLARSQESLIDFCLLAKIDGQGIGLLNLAGEMLSAKKTAVDLFMLVAEPYRGYGIGQLLLEVALDWAQETAYIETLMLEVQVRNSGAIHLYKKYGFHIDGTIENGAKSKDGDDLAVYRMCMPLG
ncbi:GNAT family N-acetyltransferase [Streptococcus dysgalactiae]|uniref:GNAT family N-acetyltransferase n=1 Tax=Streptococcus dysgalactiae TaxID=1334 RepID=UPI0010CABD73|nr:N-acetyltransferase [Streptococcus dysgalactiae]VTT06990.1 acetyl transferase [Streptococcus dysgalactiae]